MKKTIFEEYFKKQVEIKTWEKNTIKGVLTKIEKRHCIVNNAIGEYIIYFDEISSISQE